MKNHEFSFTPDRGVIEFDPQLAVRAYEGITDVIAVAGLQPVVDVDSLNRTQELTDIVSAFRRPNGQVDADHLYTTLLGLDFASLEHPRFLLISEDMKAGNMNFIFGVSHGGLSIQSLRRFIDELPTSKIGIATRHIARHEYGHLLGLSSETIRKTDAVWGHCVNECTMLQVTSTRATMELAESLSGRSHAGLCSDCVEVVQYLHR